MTAVYLKSERLKYWYNKWLAVTVCVLCVSIPTIVASLKNLSNVQGIDFAITHMMQALYLGQAGFVVAAVLFFGEEYSKSTLRSSLLSIPKRLVFLICKVLYLIIWTVIILAFTTSLSFLTLHFRFGIEISFDLLCKMLLALIPAYISTLQLCVIAASMVIISKSMVFSLAFIISMILGLGQLLMQFASVFKFLPVISAMDSFLLMKSN